MGIKIFAALLMNPSTRGFVGFVKLFFFCAIQIFLAYTILSYFAQFVFIIHL